MSNKQKPGLAGPDGKTIKAPGPVLEWTASIKLDPGSTTSPGKLRAKPGSEKAYQPVIASLGSGIVLRGQVFVPAKLLSPAALQRARDNWEAAQQAKEEGDAKGQGGKMAAGSIG